jgi:hypothetical protein
MRKVLHDCCSAILYSILLAFIVGTVWTVCEIGRCWYKVYLFNSTPAPTPWYIPPQDSPD